MSKREAITGLHRRNSRKIDLSKTTFEEDLKKNCDPPADTLGLSKITCFLLGMCVAITLNFFITANEYWMYKFRDVTANSTDANNRTKLQANFASTYNVVTSVPNVLVAFFSTFFGHHIKASIKVHTFLCTTVVLFVMHAIFVEIDTDNWQTEFFVMTMATGVLLATATSSSNVGLYSIIGKFPGIYMHYFLLGQGASDIFSAALRIFTLAAISSFNISAVMYFLTGAGLFILTTILYFVAARRQHFRHYTTIYHVEEKKTMKSLKEICSVVKDVYIVILLILLGIIIPVHTSVTSLVVSEYQGTGSAWGDTYFVPVVTYLLGSVSSVMGRAVAAKFSKGVTLKVIGILTALRSTVLPVLIYLCNAKPRHHLPVVFSHDWEYAIFLGLFLFITGYLQNSAMMLTIKLTTPEKRDTAFTLILLSIFVTVAFMTSLGVLAVNIL